MFWALHVSDDLRGEENWDFSRENDLPGNGLSEVEKLSVMAGRNELQCLNPGW